MKTWPAGWAWLSSAVALPALCQYLLLMHPMGAASDANPLAWCATSTPLQRAVGTLLEGTPCIRCSRFQCPATSHVHESVCHWIPHGQRKHTWPPASWAWGSGASLRPTATPSHNLVILDPTPESEGCPERVNAPPALGAGVKGLPMSCLDSLTVM